MPINQPGGQGNRKTNYFANMPQSQKQASQNLNRKDFQFDPSQLQFDKSGPPKDTA